MNEAPTSRDLKFFLPQCYNIQKQCTSHPPTHLISIRPFFLPLHIQEQLNQTTFSLTHPPTHSNTATTYKPASP